jgi:hypothetical protein
MLLDFAAQHQNTPFTTKPQIAASIFWEKIKMRRGPESNRRMQLLQSRALPLGYPAALEGLINYMHWRQMTIP